MLRDGDPEHDGDAGCVRQPGTRHAFTVPRTRSLEREAPLGDGYPHDLAFDQNGAAYLVPIADLPDRGACLRVKPTKNNQAKGVRWAKDCVLGDKVKVATAAG